MKAKGVQRCRSGAWKVQERCLMGFLISTSPVVWCCERSYEWSSGLERMKSVHSLGNS